MLVTYLNTQPFTKFVLIKDQLNERGKPILNYILKNHVKSGKNDIHYFVYEGIYSRTTVQYEEGDINFHDCVSNLDGWKNRISKEILLKAKTDPYFCICPCPDYKENLFSKFCNEIDKKSVVIIDSLAHLIYDYGFKRTYEMLTKLKNSVYVVQIIAILHEDILENLKFVNYFDYLSTLNITLESKRVIYIYKKLGGRIIKQIEEYRFANGNLVTEKLKKIDVISLIQQNIEIKPDNLTTFKISLEENEKKSREQLILPYLPRETESSKEAQIIYQLDAQDDWDEEDPDDDLDI